MFFMPLPKDIMITIIGLGYGFGACFPEMKLR
jgi:hypothetical protein